MTTTAEIQERHDADEEVIADYNAIAGALKIPSIEHQDRGILLDRIKELTRLHDIAIDFGHACEAEQEVAEAELEKMKTYAAHSDWCHSWRARLIPCTCGLSAILEDE